MAKVIRVNPNGTFDLKNVGNGMVKRGVLPATMEPYSDAAAIITPAFGTSLTAA